jgi:hypothetical protein
MGTRSINYLYLKFGTALTADVARFLNPDQAEILVEKRGTLILFDTNIKPMHARTGPHSCYDLEQEISVQRFLDSLPPSAFYMKRMGEECDYRGDAADHPFKDHSAVIGIEEGYNDLVYSAQRGRDAQGLWEDLVAKQGWNEASQIAVLQEFVNYENHWQALARHAASVATRENEISEDEAPVAASPSRPRP